MARRIALLVTLALATSATASPGTVHAQGASCGGQTVTVDLSLGESPTDGNDVILGTDGPDVIAAMAGDDVVCALGGDDIVWGQAGVDYVYGGGGNDKLRGGPGGDFLEGESGADDIAGGTGNDVIFGGPGDDTALRGGSGDDIIFAGAGDDRLVAGNGGLDNVGGGDGDDKVTGGPRIDSVTGGFGDDEVKGNKGADYLSGDPGDDVLFGGPQADYLDGGGGVDECNGGTTGGGAPEDDSARACEVEIGIEESAFQLADTVIGTASVGGPIVEPNLGLITDLVVVDSSPEQIVVSFSAPAAGCFAAKATALANDDTVLIQLLIGLPEDPADECDGADVSDEPVAHELVVQLAESLGGRDVLPIELMAPGPTIDFAGLGSLGYGTYQGVINEVEVVLGGDSGTPDQIKVFFESGPVECTAAEAVAFGFEDRIELLIIFARPVNTPPSTVCPDVVFDRELVIEMQQPIGGRPIVIMNPETPPG